MKIEDQIAIHEQREETARKSHAGSVIMGLTALVILTIVYLSNRGGVYQMEAKELASKMGCKYISNHISNGQKVLVAECSRAVIHKAYE